MNNYVVGFAFSKNASEVLLMRKDHPEWQRGLLNGVGGRIEEGETLLQAMNRECFEETGLSLNWELKGDMRGPDFRVWIFYAYSDAIFEYQQKENELLRIFSLEDPSWLKLKTIRNLKFLLPFGRVKDETIYVILYY